MNKLKQGDYIVRYTRSGIVSSHLIERVTATQAISTIDSRLFKFRIEVSSNNYIAAISDDKFSRFMYRLASESDLKEAKYQMALDRVTRIKWHEIDNEQLYRIVDILDNF